MYAYRIETTIAPDGSLNITHLPLPVGESVEVIILLREPPVSTPPSYSLHGYSVIYDRPFVPVAPDEWSVCS
jgi:hypothetical protein